MATQTFYFQLKFLIPFSKIMILAFGLLTHMFLKYRNTNSVLNYLMYLEEYHLRSQLSRAFGAW